MNFRIAVLAMFLLVGCKSQVFKGDLTVDQQITLKGERGKVIVAMGEYESKLSIEGSKEIELSIKDGEDTRKIEIKTKDKIKKTSQGKFYLPAERTNQNYDVRGTVVENSTVGQKQRDYEPCTFQEPYTVCYPTGRRGGVSCHTQWRTRHGYRDVEYRERKTISDLNIDMTNPNGSDALATFIGTHTKIEREYDYEGFCR